jgi:hypothetical protein
VKRDSVELTAVLTEFPPGTMASAAAAASEWHRNRKIFPPNALKYLSDAEHNTRQLRILLTQAEDDFLRTCLKNREEFTANVSFEGGLTGYSRYFGVKEKDALPQLRLVETLVSSYLSHARTYFEMMAKTCIELGREKTNYLAFRGNLRNAYEMLAKQAKAEQEMNLLQALRGTVAHERHFHAYLEGDGTANWVVYTTGGGDKPVRGEEVLAFTSVELREIGLGLASVANAFSHLLHEAAGAASE